MTNFKLACAVLVTAALGGCGGSTSYSSKPDTSTSMPQVDAAYTQVSKAAAAMPDDAEPTNVDAVVLAGPDDTEPVAL
jgi:hypothetical protein